MKYSEAKWRMIDGVSFPLCPKCLKKGIEHPMGKAGGGVSGKRMCQSYRCSKCLSTWLNTREPYVRKENRES